MIVRCWKQIYLDRHFQPPNYRIISNFKARMKFDLISIDTKFTTIPVSLRGNSSSSRSPTPQRGQSYDVKKSNASSKIEMCKSIIQGEVCPFQDKCRYAHSEHELSHQTLVERRDVGLISDLTTFRTRPCLDHVMTGSW